MRVPHRPAPETLIVSGPKSFKDFGTATPLDIPDNCGTFTGTNPETPMPRKSTSLTLDRDLIDRAKALRVNVSRAAEAGIAEALRKAEAEAWRQENRAAIEAYNAQVDREGLPLEQYRSW